MTPERNARLAKTTRCQESALGGCGAVQDHAQGRGRGEKACGQRSLACRGCRSRIRKGSPSGSSVGCFRIRQKGIQLVSARFGNRFLFLAHQVQNDRDLVGVAPQKYVLCRDGRTRRHFAKGLYFRHIDTFTEGFSDAASHGRSRLASGQDT